MSSCKLSVAALAMVAFLAGGHALACSDSAKSQQDAKASSTKVAAASSSTQQRR